MNDDDEPEPYLDGAIADALGPLKGLLAPEELEALRRALRDDVKDDPELAKLHRAARPRVAPAHTQEEAIEPRSQEPAQAAKVVPFRRKGGAA